jgi:tripartite-type tricarboxylate transporter receptor subunit TctC
MHRIVFGLIGCVLGAFGASAQAPAPFQGKTVNVIVGFAAGGGTDAYGRLAAAMLPKYLPGAPTMVVRNIPGAEGITAMNYLVQQVEPDGFTVAVASSTTADPLNYRKPASQFDATTLGVIGGAGRGGEIMLISKGAEKRLTDKTVPPVAMGALSGVPRSGMQMTAWGIEYLGWNAKWVLGYRGTNELMLALERGEIDMTSSANIFLVQKLLNSGKFTGVVQSGSYRRGSIEPRPEFGDAPIFARLMEGKIADAAGREGFAYWSSIKSIDKWLALPAKTPPAMLELYRDAYAKLSADPEFIERGKKISDEFLPMTGTEVEGLVQRLGAIPAAALEANAAMLRRQGLPTE